MALGWGPALCVSAPPLPSARWARRVPLSTVASSRPGLPEGACRSIHALYGTSLRDQEVEADPDPCPENSQSDGRRTEFHPQQASGPLQGLRIQGEKSYTSFPFCVFSSYEIIKGSEGWGQASWS